MERSREFAAGAGPVGLPTRVAVRHDLATWYRRLAAALCDDPDPRGALVAVCEVIRELLPCDRVQVWRGDVRQQSVSAVASCGYPEDEAHRLAAVVAPLPAGALGRADFVATGMAFLADAAADGDEFAQAAFQPFGLRSVAVLLLRRGDRLLGALQMSWCEGEAAPPSPEVADAIRRHASLAVDFLARTDDALRLSETLSETAIRLGSIHDPDELLQTTAATLADAVGCDWCAIHLLENGTTLFRAAQHGLPEVYEPLRRIPIAPEALAQALGSLRDGVVEVVEPHAHDDLVPGLRGTHVAAYFSVPLREHDALVGFLTLGYRERFGRFSRRQITLATGLAHHALAALRNARTMRSLREVNQFKTDFLAAVSHDLRTPLHVLIGYSDMLADGAAGDLLPAQGELVGRLREGALRFLGLINDILDVARLDAGRDALVEAPVALARLCAELRDEVEALRRPEVELSFDVGDLAVVADGGKIKTILRNLLSNALKFTREGSVRVEAARAGDDLLLRVRDTGPGIAVEDRPRIFDMFQQGDAGRRAGGSGLGLGLYLVRRLVEMLGGRIDLVSAEPGDTTFAVRLPVRFVPGRPGAPP